MLEYGAIKIRETKEGKNVSGIIILLRLIL